MSGVIREVQSIWLVRDFLADNFIEKEAVIRQWSDVITDVLSVLDFRRLHRYRRGQKIFKAVSYANLVHLRSEVSGVFALHIHWQKAGHSAQLRIGAS